MAAKTTKDSMGWFKFNVAMLTSEFTGLSDTHIAMYIKLLAIYWTSGNSMPEIDYKLHRRLGVVDPEGQAVLADILRDFFPLDSENKHSHFELDRQLNETKAFGREQSARAKLPRTGRKPTENSIDHIGDEDDF
jgi:uncharacterized protein YdaU (DUF1376 family)